MSALEENDEYDSSPRFRSRTTFRLPNIHDLAERAGRAVDVVLRSSSRETTNLAKQGLRDLANSCRLECHCSEEQGRKEWLYDVVFLYPLDENGHFRDILLIGEIELARDERAIFDDFRKLLIGRAPIKLFAFRTGDPEHHRTRIYGDDLRARMKQMVNGFRNSEEGEIYVLVDLGSGINETFITNGDDLNEYELF
jgi:hypothetical protein